MSRRKAIPGQLAFDFDAPAAIGRDLADNIQHLIDVGVLTRFGLDTVNGGTVHNSWGGDFLSISHAPVPIPRIDDDRPSACRASSP